jgi:hypothetical protein
MATHIGLRDTALGYGSFVALVAVGALGYERIAGQKPGHG